MSFVLNPAFAAGRILDDLDDHEADALFEIELIGECSRTVRSTRMPSRPITAADACDHPEAFRSFA